MRTLVIFGASGDLTRRKLIPALFQLAAKGRLPEPIRIIGSSRSSFTSEAWRDDLRQSTAGFLGNAFRDEDWARFAQKIEYLPGDLSLREDMLKLRAFIEGAETSDMPCHRLYYLATAPGLYDEALQLLGETGQADESNGSRRIVIEKPFGSDLQSAQELNQLIHGSFAESQVYRIDHYLGKETVQNLLVLRFANTIFEPIWSRNYIEHVQITVSEDGLVGQRGAYYDQAGVLRDMFQNHLLQLLTITAMEAPPRFEANLVRDEKVKVLRSVRKLQGADFARDTCRAQYQGYCQEPGVPANSQTATFAAIKLHVDNWRWNDVPFYLRSGKGMSCRTTQIVIQFRQPPHLLFDSHAHPLVESNRLVIQVQPAEGIQLHFQSKVPDAGMQVRQSHLDFNFRQHYGHSIPDAYQRLLLDAINGDASLFARSDEVELAWGIIDPILAAWESPAAPPLQSYEPGLWGPPQLIPWMEQQGRQWFDVCPVIAD